MSRRWSHSVNKEGLISRGVLWRWLMLGHALGHSMLYWFSSWKATPYIFTTYFPGKSWLGKEAVPRLNTKFTGTFVLHKVSMNDAHFFGFFLTSFKIQPKQLFPFRDHKMNKRTGPEPLTGSLSTSAGWRPISTFSWLLQASLLLPRWAE